MLEYLIKRSKFSRSPLIDIARVGIGVAIRAGADRPDISTVAAFKQSLLRAKSISYTGGSSAGIYLAGLMERLGIAEQMKPKTKVLGGGGQNPKAVAAGDVELGLSIISDILPVAGAELLGPLPPDLQHYVMLTGGVSVAATERAEANALLTFLKGSSAAAAFKSKGYEPVGQ